MVSHDFIWVSSMICEVCMLVWFIPLLVLDSLLVVIQVKGVCNQSWAKLKPDSLLVASGLLIYYIIIMEISPESAHLGNTCRSLVEPTFNPNHIATIPNLEPIGIALTVGINIPICFNIDFRGPLLIILDTLIWEFLDPLSSGKLKKFSSRGHYIINKFLWGTYVK